MNLNFLKIILFSFQLKSLVELICTFFFRSLKMKSISTIASLSVYLLVLYSSRSQASLLPKFIYHKSPTLIPFFSPLNNLDPTKRKKKEKQAAQTLPRRQQQLDTTTMGKLSLRHEKTRQNQSRDERQQGIKAKGANGFHIFFLV